MEFTTLVATAAVAMACLVAGLSGAHADWRDGVPVFRMGILGGDLEARRIKDFACLKERVGRALEVPVELWPSRDYSGITAGLLSGELQAASLGPGVYAAIFLQDP